jgi:hypothetical protein
MNIQFRFELTGGTMLYDHERDTWNVWGDRVGKCGELNANAYRTIREFKGWAQSAIEKAELVQG